MATTITTTTQVSAPGFSGQRKIVRLSNGTLVAAVNSLASTRWEFWASSTPGSWGHATALDLSYAGSSSVTGSLFADVDDNLHFVYVGASGTDAGDVKYVFSAPPYTGWSTPLRVLMDLYSAPDVVAHRDPAAAGWIAHVVATAPPAGIGYARVQAGTSPSLLTSGGFMSGSVTSPSIDFAHTGDGVSTATPHLYVVGSNASGIRYLKFAYSPGIWTAGTERSISTDVASSGRVSSCFDGSRTIMAWVPSSATTTIKVSQRDAADTLTTALTAPPAPGGVVIGLSVTTDSVGNVILTMTDATTGNPWYVIYTRATATWGSWTQIEAVTCNVDSVTVRRAAGFTIDTLHAASLTSPYTIKHNGVTINVAPNAPNWTSASGAYDVASGLLLDWDFSDANPADTQASYVLKRDIGGTIRYYRASDNTWQTTEQTNVSTSSAVTVPSGWGVDADPNHLYYVKTTDAGGLTGPYSAALVVTPSVKVNPTLDEPDPGDVITTASATLQWTVATQVTYRAVVTVTGTGAVVWDSGWVADSAAREATSPAVLANGGSYTASIQTTNTEGLASTAATAAFTVTYIAPATPTLTVNDTTNPWIFVTVANPTPSGGQPAIASNDIYVRVAAGGRPDGERPVAGAGIRIATGVANNGRYDDYAVASDTEYEYQAVARGTNGTVAASAWTS